MTPVSHIAHSGTVASSPPRAPTRPALQALMLEDEAGGTYRARLVAADQTPQGALATLPGWLQQHGFSNQFVDVWQGQHVLVVSGLTGDTQEQLTGLLQAMHLVEPGAITYNGQGNLDLLKENLRRDTLKWSGRAAFAASSAIALAGAAQRDWSRVFTGAGFALADSVVAIYGNGQGPIDFDRLFRDMNRHFQANGIDFPAIATPEKQRNTVEKVHDFIATHPVQINYSLGMLGSMSHIRSGFLDFQRSGAGISRMAKGALGTAGSGAVVLVPEGKHRDDDGRDWRYYITHPLEAPRGLFDFVFKSPIRFKGLVSTVYSALYLSDTLEEHKKMRNWAVNRGGEYYGKSMQTLTSELAKVVVSPEMEALEPVAIERAGELRKGISELQRRESLAKTFWGGRVSPYLSAVTGIGYMLASVLAAASSTRRDASFEAPDEYEKMYAMAAQALRHFPSGERRDVLQQMATYLSTQKDVEDGEIQASRIIEEVNQRVERLGQSPWLPAQERERAAPTPAR